MNYEQENKNLEVKIKSLGQIYELRMKQKNNRSVLQKIWKNKFKVLVVFYMIARFVKDLIVIKLLKG